MGADSNPSRFAEACRAKAIAVLPLVAACYLKQVRSFLSLIFFLLRFPFYEPRSLWLMLFWSDCHLLVCISTSTVDLVFNEAATARGLFVVDTA